MDIPSRQLILIVHDIRSSHNVGSLLRTADGIGVEMVYLTGYSPYPRTETDDRLPHLANKIHAAVAKTALGAEHSQPWKRETDITELLARLRTDGFTLAALEQAADSRPLPGFQPPAKLAILIGREVEGIDPALLARCDLTLEIPMSGAKESFNVAQATAMVLYHCRFAA